MATEKRLKGYDPITLESFIRHMTKHREPYDQYDMGYVDAFEQIENWLEYNAVDAVEVVHGQWIDEYPNVRCSVCNAEWLNCITDNEPKLFYYCPNCGANSMDGERKDND